MKEYKQPRMEVLDIKDNIILAGSLETKTGKTTEQYAKKRTVNDFDDFEDDEYEDLLSIRN